ncbi:PREDICTED: tropinone reductase homolog At1g07440-like isoform X5 [Populus euphratica]|uniref:Tropinone reductase homolog At1g07440-like isoform X5 n=1 Tax=Populus euphratica TaxID=75702 RepID=A0AAJ6VJH3_POPEU|nr:PREDICTED: tropinone reductase homolog At1g07440-like isoform X5 [Populus euphratica]
MVKRDGLFLLLPLCFLKIRCLAFMFSCISSSILGFKRRLSPPPPLPYLFRLQNGVELEERFVKMSQQENSSRDKKWSLQGMTALVTGGTKGLGYAIVGELAALGAIVHTCGRSQDQLNENLREWKAKGFKVTGSVCDLSSNAEREKLMEEVSSFFDGKLDILINNAGGNIHKGSLDYTSEDFVSILNTNLGSAFHLSQLAHPLLKASGAGRIVFMSSIASVVSVNPQYPIYSATKGTWHNFLSLISFSFLVFVSQKLVIL